MRGERGYRYPGAACRLADGASRGGTQGTGQTTKATTMMQIAFSDSAKDDAFTRPGGRCECTRSSHPLIPASRGTRHRHPARV
jgi:hypothetical protein